MGNGRPANGGRGAPKGPGTAVDGGRGMGGMAVVDATGKSIAASERPRDLGTAGAPSPSTAADFANRLRSQDRHPPGSAGPATLTER